MRLGESMTQCSMFFLNQKLYTAIIINKRNGNGKISFGIAHKQRMRITYNLTQRQLRNLSDIEIFNVSSDSKLLVVSQSQPEGKCFVFKSNADIDDG